MGIRTVSLSLIILLLLFSGCSYKEVDELPPRPSPITISTPEPVFDIECAHFWKNPDCQDPYTCFDCGETKGDPLEHIWTIANYQEASLCELCGETNGDPLEPNFTAYGLRINTTSGRPYSYKTITNLDPDMNTFGIAALLYGDIFESDTDYPEKAGYEYITARFMITFDDENARTNGFQYLIGQIDYYGFDPNEAAVIYEDLRGSDIPDFKVANRKLNYFGTDYEYYIKHTQIQNEWVGDTAYLVLEYTSLVPAGYDGLVLYVSNAANWTDSASRVLADNFDSDTLFFRLRVQTS